MHLTLPNQIAHADWGTDGPKRAVATARLIDGSYVVDSPARVLATGTLVERMHLDPSAGGGVLLGFDFPIGLPRAFAARAGISNFKEWLRATDPEGQFFDVCQDLDEVSLGRPFFPRHIPTKSPGIKALHRDKLGITAEECLRHCDRAHCGRGPASDMFWTLGAKAVGKATLSGWKTALRPALDEPALSYALWPFDGSLSELPPSADAVIVETYPAEAYVQLHLGIGPGRGAKTKQADRRGEAPRLHALAADQATQLDPALIAQIDDGFGPAASGEDPFDALVGLLGIIATLRRASQPELPGDPAVREVEGWMFGQHARCNGPQ